MAPVVLLGLGLGFGLAFLKRKSTSSPALSASTTDAQLIDASEKTHPNAEMARRAIVAALHYNSRALFATTATAIEVQLRMPKTARNLRTWATMAEQGGQTVAGEDSYGEDDEVGAARRHVRRVFAARVAKAKPKRRARPKMLARSNPMGDGEELDTGDDDAGDDDAGDDDAGDDEVGARAQRRTGPLPEWLRFSATQSKLAGDPRLIRATATVMRRMGYFDQAEIHLAACGAQR